MNRILASEELPLSAGTDGSGSFNSQLTPLMGTKSKKPTIVEGCLPWRRDKFDWQGTTTNHHPHVSLAIHLIQ